jgi:hypothetical protein
MIAEIDTDSSGTVDFDGKLFPNRYTRSEYRITERRRLVFRNTGIPYIKDNPFRTILHTSIECKLKNILFY